ncbi:hypothetical protein LCGC14_2604410, partial [marine sediment metagenome]
MYSDAVLFRVRLTFLMRVRSLVAVSVVVRLGIEMVVAGVVLYTLVRVLVGVPEPVFVSVTHRLGGLVSPSNGGGNSPARALSIIRRWVIEAIAPPVGYTIRGHLHFGAPAITVGAAQAVSSVGPGLVCRSSGWLQRAQY